MILKELSTAIGVSGEEQAVRKIIREAIRDHVTDIEVDSIGNLTALKKGTGNGPRVMIAAHMDEIGFMISGYDSSGALRFTNVGGVDARILPGLRLKVGKKALPGIIQWGPIHKTYSDRSVKEIKDLRIDIGATSKSSAEGMVKIGERATFDTTFMEIGEHILRGKAFDDRAGCATLVEILRGGPYSVDILAAFTVQEEIGLRGARVAAERLKPDVAFVLEGTTAHDLPDPNADPDDPIQVNPACKLGAGPALTVMDRSMIVPPQLLRFLRETADAENIPYQLKTALGGGTDGGQIHLSGSGVPTAVISTPCRYIHAPAAILDKRDFDAGVRLLQAALARMNHAVVTPV